MTIVQQPPVLPMLVATGFYECSRCGQPSADVRYDRGTDLNLCNPCWAVTMPGKYPNSARFMWQ